VYVALGVVVLFRWLIAWVALQALLRRSEPVRGRAAEVFAAMTAGGWAPRLLASRQVRAPFSCGLFRPTVVLPAPLCETASDEVLRWVYAHELAHLERRDAWSGLLFGLAQAVYFPIPWFWRLRRQARLCQEYLADAAAAADGGRPEDYAQFLLAWTAAPRPPIGACGVWGHTSDLFWRVKTMLQSTFPLERRCPRRWSLAAACGLLSLAVLAAGVTWKASAAPAPEQPQEQPKKDEPKKDQPKPEQPKAGDPAAPAVPELPAFPNIDDLLKNAPAGLPPEVLQQYRQNMQMMREQWRRTLELQRQAAGQPFQFNPVFPGLQPQDGRLGAAVEKPGDTLVEQLELPKDQGLILREVTPDSAAAKAGLKAHDILLELDGKPVSSNPDEFRKALEGVKADKPVDVVVLRKGKKETVKGLSLPEAKAAAPLFPGINPGALPNFPQPIVPNIPPLIPGNAFNPGFGVGNSVITTTFRTNDHFTTRHQEGSLIITLTGKVADGKATVSEISVQDGAESNKYESVDKVPEKYRDKVQNLVDMSEKGTVKVEIKGP
jgi:membrane-associated protease RseP (regulator of RpoE activity)